MMKNLAIRYLLLCSLFLLLPALSSAQTYIAYCTVPSQNEVALIQFNGTRAQVAEVIEVGRYLTEAEEPNGITVAPDGKHWFLSVARGSPNGYLHKYETGTNRFVTQLELGLFPASMEISRSTGLLYVVNRNLKESQEPSSVMVVDPETMTLVDQIQTEILPSGSRLNKEGTLHYHVSTLSDELIEINALTMEVQRRITIAADGSHEMKADGKMMDMPNKHHTAVAKAKPVWATPHPWRDLVYVASSGSDEVVEVNVLDWKVTQRFQVGESPNRMEVSPNGKYLIVTYSGEGATGIWDLQRGIELARISNSSSVSRGVAITDDNKYAFITVKSATGKSGAVDVIDLNSRELVSSVRLGGATGGIYFWKMENRP